MEESHVCSLLSVRRREPHARRLTLLAVLCTLTALAAPAWSQSITTLYSQDQIIYTTTLTAQITNASGWTVDSMTITVDETNTTTASISGSGTSYIQGTIPWTDTSGNPSEHTIYAQATIHNYYG